MMNDRARTSCMPNFAGRSPQSRGWNSVLAFSDGGNLDLSPSCRVVSPRVTCLIRGRWSVLNLTWPLCPASSAPVL